MKTITITLNPREWIVALGLALRNSCAAVLDSFKNPRLWIGIGTSLLVHAVIILLALIQYGGGAVPKTGEDSVILLAPVGDLPPSVVERMAQDRGAGRGSSEAITRPRTSPASDVIVGRFTLTPDMPDASLVENMLRIPEKQLSVDEILQMEPISLERGTQGTRQRFSNQGSIRTLDPANTSR